MVINTNYYMVRAGKSGIAINEFLQSNTVAIGWNAMGKLKENATIDDIKKLLNRNYPNLTERGIAASARQIIKFLYEFKIGDHIITFDPITKVYYTGIIESEVMYDSSRLLHHYRKVHWNTKTVAREDLALAEKKTLNALLSIFKIPQTTWVALT